MAGVEGLAGGDRAGVVLGERDGLDAFAFEFLGGLSESPGVEHDFFDGVAGGEFADVVYGVEHAAVAVVDAGAYV
jgi:hypothetical protein